MHRSTRHRLQTSAGFGLVELMVSVAIGLVILAALVALFAGTTRNNREMATANSVIENGRFAIQLLESDIIHAGYWGLHVPQFDDQTFTTVPADTPTSVPDPCAAFPADWDTVYVRGMLGIPAQAYDTVSDCAGVITARVPDTDVLVVRHAETCIPGVGGCAADAAGKVYLQVSTCTTELGAPLRFGATGTAAFDLTQRDCATTAEKRRVLSHIYYVRNYAAAPGDGIPTLVRSELDLAGGTLAHQPAVPLIEGIDGFRVQFGIDDRSWNGSLVDYGAPIAWDDPLTKTRANNRGDGIPDGNFVRCSPTCSEAQLMNATAIRIHVLARSREPTTGYTDTKTYTLDAGTVLGPFDDGFKRHVYSTTVRLPNVSGRRERP